jgi:hypothetical protein
LQKKYPGESPYNFVGNSVLFFADRGGKDKITTLTIMQKDGKTIEIKIRDKSQFYYYKDQNFQGTPIYAKRDILEHDILDLRKEPDKNGSQLQLGSETFGGQTQQVSASEYYGHMFGTAASYLKSIVGDHSGDQSNLTLDGYRIFGTSTAGDPGDYKKLPQGGPGTELLDLAGVLSAVSVFRGGEASPAEFLKEGNKAKDVIEQVENLTSALEKAVDAKEEMEKHPSEFEKIKAGADSCIYCHQVGPANSMWSTHPTVVPTKGTHIVKKD